jgi:CheY-like chemotaxis protein
MNPTILVIEDDPPAAHLLDILLGREGYQTLIALNGVEALEIVRTQPIDLILLDLMLPGLDGFEVLNRLRNDPRTATLPVAVISAKSQLSDKRAAARVGADAYLTKPYKNADLLVMVGSLLHTGIKKAREHSACAILAESHREETARVVLSTGLAMVGRGETPTVVDLHPRSTLYSSLLRIPPRSSPISLADPEKLGQLAKLIVQHPSGLRLLDGLEGRDKAGQITCKDVDALLDMLLTEGAFVLADLPLYYSTEVLCAAASRCTQVLLVTRGDPDSLRGTRAALTMMQRSGIDESRIGIVAVGSITGTGLLEFGQKVLCVVPMWAAPDHPVFRDLAEWLRSMARSSPAGGAQDTT